MHETRVYSMDIVKPSRMNSLHL